MKPYYQDDSVTLYHGDAFELPLRTWPARIITDPPYGASAYESDRAPSVFAIGEWIRWAATSAFFGYPETLALWCAKLQVHPSEWVTWWPTNKDLKAGRLLPRTSEHIAVFGEVCGATQLFRPRTADDSVKRIYESARGKVAADQARLGDVWRDAAPGMGFNGHLRQHPNEKPLSLMVKLVTLCSNAGDLVIDPFAGSGTTLVAAKTAGRRAVGVEIEERFCEIAAQRCSQEVLAVA